MPKDLIIVESPAKTRTLSRFLGKDYVIKASLGHVRDLPKSRLGVNIEAGFEPRYSVIKDRQPILKELRAAAAKAGQVYLATDPDREGEAIAWHLQQALKLGNARRIEFNEITESAVRNALAHPRTLDVDRVDAQQARRVLDRLVGYQVSPLLWKKVRRNLSAGRVQSVALRLVVEREREIEGFVPREYWSLAAQLTVTGAEAPFEARLVRVDGNDVDLANRDAMQAVLARLLHRLRELPPAEDDDEQRPRFASEADPAAPPGPPAEWRIAQTAAREERRNAPPPFITSTLQMEASRKLGFSTRRTMIAAQRLYEGVELPGQGPVGLITYMRTDSTRLSAEAREMARAFISSHFGENYTLNTPRRDRQATRAQDAHEAIRPTHADLEPGLLRSLLQDDEHRLYTLIWQRFLASQMAPAVFEVTTAEIPVADLLFRATGRRVLFDGFTRVYQEGRDEDAADDTSRLLPPLAEGDLLELLELLPRQHFTTPPPRFTEATLVRSLEQRGIGRPSTYAQIISTLLDREYVILEARRFHPTQLGCTVTDLLVRHFPAILDVDFTAKVEDQLDQVEEGERNWVNLLTEFYVPFQAALERAEQEMEDLRPKPVETDIPCPKCGAKLLIRTGRYGRFLGCSSYPECRHVGELPPELMTEEERAQAAQDAEIPPCPQCGAEMVRRQGRYGTFYGCSRYPDCKTIVDPKRKEIPAEQQVEIACPRDGCGGTVTAKMSRRGTVFYGCSNYPKCEFVSWDKPTDQTCDECGYPMGEHVARGAAQGLRCTNMDCTTNAARKKAAAARRGRARPRRAAASRSGRR